MCGIAGVAMAPGASLPDEATLDRLSAAIAHRGPDGQGRSVAGRVALLHRRLAIIDREGGAQPLHAGAATLIANGEIYNDLELRAGLPGIRFATGSDCETPLHLFAAAGDGYAETLRGMYAIALHDRRDDALLLSRDPFGIKPLYVAAVPGGLAFASEAAALLDAGLVTRAVDPAARGELLGAQFTSGAATIFPGIRRVRPGETLRIVDGAVAGRRRIDALPAGAPVPVEPEQALAQVDAALVESVALHLRSERESGLFLSGGIDSAVLLATATRLAGPPVCFTARFDVPGAADESAHAVDLARAVGRAAEVLTVTRDDAWAHLPAIVAAMDDPVADYAIIPTWLLARRAAERGIRVVVSGEGGDEMFAGYGRYRRAMRPWWRGGRRMRARGRFDGLGVLRPSVAPGRARVEADAPSARTALAAAQAADMEDWLPHDLLLKLDRCLMAHGVEGRTPFVDPGIAAVAFGLPDELKVRGHQGKVILREWLARHLPAARPFAPKQGFSVPVGDWIAADAGRLGPLVARCDCVREIAEPARVEALFHAAAGRRERHAAWTLLFFALWHRIHVEGVRPDGDVFAMLGGG